MVRIPAGDFVMGSPMTEVGRIEDEGPAHRVTIRSFEVSKYPITVAQFRMFVSETHYEAGHACFTDEAGSFSIAEGRTWRNPGFVQGEDEPVVCVSWIDANAYTAWLSRKSGQTYRLLTEAEYEYANRAGSTAAHWWGDNAGTVCAHANVADLEVKVFHPAWATVNCHDGFARTSPVGHFRPNGFGLFDTTGNVWSWTQDCYAPSYVGAPEDGSAFLAGQCAQRVLRGGSWNRIPRFLRSAVRMSNLPTNRFSNTGFRVARSS
jgi:formylglycine-generating enzyme required for sulfatase activity